MKKWKLCNGAILELLQIYGAVKILLAVTFDLLRRFCVPFAESLVNCNIFGT